MDHCCVLGQPFCENGLLDAQEDGFPELLFPFPFSSAAFALRAAGLRFCGIPIYGDAGIQACIGLGLSLLMQAVSVPREPAHKPGSRACPFMGRKGSLDLDHALPKLLPFPLHAAEPSERGWHPPICQLPKSHSLRQAAESDGDCPPIDPFPGSGWLSSSDAHSAEPGFYRGRAAGHLPARRGALPLWPLPDQMPGRNH